MLGENFADDGAKIGRERKVAAFVKLVIVQAGPFAIDLAALHVATHDEHAIRMAVVGTAIAVFLGGASELAHGHDDDVLHASAHVLMERRKTLAEILQQIRELALHSAFVDVIVPAAAIDEKNFHTDV